MQKYLVVILAVFIINTVDAARMMEVARELSCEDVKHIPYAIQAEKRAPENLCQLISGIPDAAERKRECQKFPSVANCYCRQSCNSCRKFECVDFSEKCKMYVNKTAPAGHQCDEYKMLPVVCPLSCNTCNTMCSGIAQPAKTVMTRTEYIASLRKAHASRSSMYSFANNPLLG